MIKVVNLISLIAAPVIVQYQGRAGSWVAAFVLTGLFVWALRQSKNQNLAVS